MFAVFVTMVLLCRKPKNKFMYYSDLNASLVGTDYNICAMFQMDSFEPIIHGLRAVGGYLVLSTIKVNDREIYDIRYWTPDNRISILVELEKSEYLHNLDFIGQDYIHYDDPIQFIANGKKLQLP